MFAQNILGHSGDCLAPSKARSVAWGGWSSTRLFAILLASVFGLGAMGCGTAPRKPPEAPLKQAVRDAPFEDEMLDPDTHHLAPPPAYGNKVVMAKQAPNREHF